MLRPVRRAYAARGTRGVDCRWTTTPPRPHAVPEWVARMVGGDPRAMAAAGGIAFLLGSPAQIADVLRRRRDQFGVSYVAVSAMFMEQFAPVIADLRRRDA